MSLVPIPIDAFTARAYAIWDKGWFLLTCGDFAAGHYNTMTVSWGAFGCMWARPFAQVVVRPQRYTREFIDAFPTFTLCAFPAAQRKALNLLGTQSGRDGDKIARAGLTPLAASQVAAPAFAEAELVVECRKIYWQDFDPGHFLDPALIQSYPSQDYHRVYYGEIVAVHGTPAYLAA
jgi:flavin reductase (DIM6/NTAB) family NADH-FMN oxidoreductase RutF